MDEAEIRRRLCEILGVNANASAEEIKNGYSREAKKWHPDRVQHNTEFSEIAEQKLKDINQAYECLTDPAQFQRYAEKLAQKGQSSESSRSQRSESASQAPSPNPPVPPEAGKSSIVKIFLATGLFVLIVIVVANVTSPRHSEPPRGVVPLPSESPGAPFFRPQTYRNSLPSDSSVGPPPGSNQ